MTTNNQYLRVSDTWELLLGPREVPNFLANVSGTTVLVQLSPSQLTNPALTEAYALAVGGTIPQLKVGPEQYLYAKAYVADTETGSTTATVTVGENRLNTGDIAALRDMIATVAAQVMRLSERVTDNEIKLDADDLIFEHIRRNWLYTDTARQKSIAQLSKQIINLATRLFSAESILLKFRLEFPGIKIQLADLIDRFETSGNQQLAEIITKVNSISVQLDAVTSRLNTLEPKVEEGWQDYDTLIKETITPIKTDLSDLTRDFNFLNNSLVTLAATYTDAEIDAAFTLLLKSASEKIREPLTALKNCILELRHAVDYADNLILDPNILKTGWLDGSVELPTPDDIETP